MTLRTLAVAATLLAASTSARAAQVWTALATEKIRPAAAARTAASASISAARNEFEAFQVVVTGPATNVRATAAAFTGPGSIGDVRLFRVATIDAPYASALDGATGAWPDALVPDVDELTKEKRNAFPFTVATGESRAIWVEVRVPPDAPAGEYGSKVEVTWDGGGAMVPVTLRVWPFTLPSTASLKSAFGLSWGTLNKAHGVSGDALSTVRARYGQLALEHRLSLSKIDDGNRDLNHFASFYGAQFSGTSPAALPGAKMTAIEYLGGASAYASWQTFFTGKGWSDELFQYTCDEPPLTCAWTDIPTRAASARAAGIRTLVTTTMQEAQEKGVLSSIDILVPVINFLDGPSGEFAGPQRAKYDAWLAADPRRELWSYQSCMSHGCGGTVNMSAPNATDKYYTGWPSYMIDASAVRNRAMEWISFINRLTGELYWETTYAFSADPWSSQWGFSGNGDGTLFYPGTPSKIGGSSQVPVASIRLKMIREGMEDYEYLKLLSDAGDPALARQVATTLFPHAYQTEQSPAALMAAREQLAARIVELTAPGGGGTGGDTGGSGGGSGGDAGGTGGGAGGDSGGTGGGAGGGSIETPVTPRDGGGCNGGAAGGLLALTGLAGAVRIRRRRAS